MTQLEKDPIIEKQVPSNWYVPVLGVRGTSTWAAAWEKSIEKVQEGYFIVRDTNSEDGNPVKASEWSDLPLTGARALASIRYIIVMAIGVTAVQAEAYGTSSPRHFLPAWQEHRSNPWR